MNDDAPLSGVRVIDASRMIPGAVLAQRLVHLGAEVVKVEDPRGGDPLRAMPPMRGGVGVGFAVWYAGARSVALQLGREPGNAGLAALVASADVLVESFRTGTLDRWGLPLEGLRSKHPRLVTVSLPSYPSASESADEVAHDMNVLARSGLLARIGAQAGVPRVQLVDVTTGLLAAEAVLAALLRRARSGRGGHIEQPLASGALPHVAWAWADHAAAGVVGASERVIGGGCASYALYRCGDGERIAVGCLEPKFWRTLCETMGVVELVPDGLRDDERGRAAHARIESLLASAPAHEWRTRLVAAGLPVDVVRDVGDARQQAELWLGPLGEQLAMPDGSTLFVPTRAVPSLDRTPPAPAPRLGEHTEAALLAARAAPETIAACIAAATAGA